jgi:hypothetical protein
VQIIRIIVYQIDLPFVDGSYLMAKGKGVAVADNTVVRLETVGYGETCPRQDMELLELW